MRSHFPLALLASLAACTGASADLTSTAGGSDATSTASTTSAASSTGAGAGGADPGPCEPGETLCDTTCILGADCAHSVSADPPQARTVFVNGATFIHLDATNAEGIQGVRVGGAVAAFRVDSPAGLWIEVPPGAEGDADITVQTKDGDVTSKRALTYRSAPEGTSWTKKTMSAARGGFPAMATTFFDRALVAAGYTAPQIADCTDTADIFDREEQASTPAANTMSTKRWTATATTTLEGNTIIAGACYQLTWCPYDSKLLDVFSPTTNTFKASTAQFSVLRGFLRNLLLADGRVLFASDEVPHFEIYDPRTDTMAAVAGGTFSTLSPVTGSLARLRDGRVLVVPGGGLPNSIFDPAAGTFTATGDSLPQYPDALVAIGDGRVFAIGGITVSDQNGAPQQTTTDAIDVFDPKTNSFAPWPTKLATSRFQSTAVLARDGGIYVIGGLSGTAKLYFDCANDADIASFDFLSSVEIVDPIAGTVSPGPSLPEANISLRSTVLYDGSIVAGGGTPCGSKALSFPSIYFLEAPPVPR